MRNSTKTHQCKKTRALQRVIRRSALAKYQYHDDDEHIAIPELVKKLVVPPGKRTEDDCELMAGALHVFISSLPAFNEGLSIL